MASRTSTARIMPFKCTCGADVIVEVDGLSSTVTPGEWQASLTPDDRALIHRMHDGDEPTPTGPRTATRKLGKLS